MFPAGDAMTLWLVLLIGFLLGCAWNSRAYDRGFRDGRELEIAHKWRQWGAR